MQVVGLVLHSLQDVGLICSCRASCETKNVYTSLKYVYDCLSSMVKTTICPLNHPIVHPIPINIQYLVIVYIVQVIHVILF